jgi:hypothetical protein
MSTFDYEGAIAQGLTDEDILGHFSETNPSFDFDSAKQKGISTKDVADYLSSTPKEYQFDYDQLDTGAKVLDHGGLNTPKRKLLGGSWSDDPLFKKGKEINDSFENDDQRKSYEDQVKSFKEINDGKKDIVNLGGTLVVNHKFTFDDDGYKNAVDKSGYTARQKQEALAKLPYIQQQASSPIVASLEETDFGKTQLDSIRSQNPDANDAEVLKKFYAEVPQWRRNIEEIALKTQAGWHGLSQSTLGVASAFTRAMQSDPAMSAANSIAQKKLGETVPEFYSDISQQEAQQAERLNRQAEANKPSKVLGISMGDVAGVIPSLAPTIALAPAGFAGMVVGAGLQQLGGTFSDAEAGYAEQIKQSNPDMPDTEVKDAAALKAYAPATLDALVTAGLTALGGKAGVQAIARKSVEQGSKTLAQRAGMIGAGALKEGLIEEGPSQLASGLIAQQSYNPEMTNQEIIEGGKKAALLGGVAGLGGEVIENVSESNNERGAAIKAGLATPPPAANTSPATTATVQPEATAEGILDNVDLGEDTAAVTPTTTAETVSTPSATPVAANTAPVVSTQEPNTVVDPIGNAQEVLGFAPEVATEYVTNRKKEGATDADILLEIQSLKKFQDDQRALNDSNLEARKQKVAEARAQNRAGDSSGVNELREEQGLPPVSAPEVITEQPITEQPVVSEQQVDPSVTEQTETAKPADMFTRLNDWDKTHRRTAESDWFEGARVDENGRRGFNEALLSGGDKIQAHGMTKEGTLIGATRNLLTLLKDGLDPNRRGGQLDTAPLVNNPGEGLVGATATGSAYSDGPFMILQKPGTDGLTGRLENAGAILVNEAHPEFVPELRSAIQDIRPDIIVDSYANAGEVVKQLSSSPEVAEVTEQPIANVDETIAQNTDPIEDLISSIRDEGMQPIEGSRYGNKKLSYLEGSGVWGLLRNKNASTVLELLNRAGGKSLSEASNLFTEAYNSWVGEPTQPSPDFINPRAGETFGEWAKRNRVSISEVRDILENVKYVEREDGGMDRVGKPIEKGLQEIIGYHHEDDVPKLLPRKPFSLQSREAASPLGSSANERNQQGASAVSKTPAASPTESFGNPPAEEKPATKTTKTGWGNVEDMATRVASGEQIVIPDNIFEKDDFEESNPRIEWAWKKDADGQSKPVITAIKSKIGFASSQEKELTDSAVTLGEMPTSLEIQKTMRGTGSGNAVKEITARIKAALDQAYPSEIIPEGAEVIQNNTSIKGSGFTAPYIQQVDGSGIVQVRPFFSNVPTETASQIDRGDQVIVPDYIVQQGKVNPAIHVSKNESGTYTVESVDLGHRGIGIISKPGSLETAYKNSAEFVARNEAKTKGKTEFLLPQEQPRYTNVTNNMRKAEKEDEKMALAEKYFAKYTETEEQGDRITSVARQIYLRALRQNTDMTPNAAARYAKKKINEKLAVRPDSESLDVGFRKESVKETTTNRDTPIEQTLEENFLDTPMEMDDNGEIIDTETVGSNVDGELAATERAAVKAAEISVLGKMGKARRVAYDAAERAIQTNTATTQQKNLVNTVNEQIEQARQQMLTLQNKASGVGSDSNLPFDPEVQVRKLARSPEYRGISFVADKGLDAVMSTTGENRVISYNPDALNRMVSRRSPEAATELLKMVMDEEAEHIAGIKTIPFARAIEITEKMTPEQRASVARKYLGVGAPDEDIDELLGNKPGMTPDEIEEAKARLGYEYLRMLRQNLRYGDTSETLRDIFESPKSIIDSLLQYLRNIANRLKALWEVSRDERLKMEMDMIANYRDIISNHGAYLQTMGLPADTFATLQLSNSPTEFGEGRRLNGSPFQFQFVRNFEAFYRGERSTFLRSLNLAKDGTLPFQNFVAQLRGITPKGEFEVIRPVMQGLVKDGRINLSEAIDAAIKVGKSIVSVNTLDARAKKASARSERLSATVHELDTLWSGWNEVMFTDEQGDQINRFEVEEPPDQYVADLISHYLELSSTSTATAAEGEEEYNEDPAYASISNQPESATARFTEVNPKQLIDMPDARDILVQEPLDDFRAGDPKFMEYVHFPTKANIIGFGRMYTETLPSGEKGTFVFEVQSDWASNPSSLQNKIDEASRKKAYLENRPDPSLYGVAIKKYKKEIARLQKLKVNAEKVISKTPLVNKYEPLVVKAAIEQAIRMGHKYLIMSDARTAMMTEHHDQHPDRKYNLTIDQAIENLTAAGYEVRLNPDSASPAYDGVPVKAYTIYKPKGVKPEPGSGGRAWEQYAGKPVFFMYGRAYDDETIGSLSMPVGKLDARSDATRDKILKDAGLVLINNISQQSGMYLAYQLRLQKLAARLTGSYGIPVNLGIHKNGPSPMLKEGPNPKTSITGFAYDLTKVKAQLDREGSFSLFRKQTQALKKNAMASSPEARDAIGSITYFPSTEKGDLKEATDWVKEGLDAGKTMEDLVDDLHLLHPYGGLTSNRQKILAQAILAEEYKKLAAKVDQDMIQRGSLDKSVLSDYYKQMETKLKMWLVKTANEAASDLNIFKTIAGIITNNYAVSEYITPLFKAQKEQLGASATVKATKDAVKTGIKNGASSTVSKSGKLVRKIVREKGKTKVDAAGKAVLDVFDSISDSQDSTPLGIQYADKAAKSISTKIIGSAKVGITGPALEAIRVMIEANISQRLKEVMSTGTTTATGAPTFDRESAVAALAGELDLSELAERAFNSAVQAVLADPKATPEQKAALQNATFDGGDLRKAQEIIRKEESLREIIRQGLSEQQSSREALIGDILSNSDLTTEQATAVAEALRQAFVLEARKLTRGLLDNIVSNKLSRDAREKAPDQPTIEKLLKLINIGTFTEEKFYNAIADQYNLPTWDAAFVAKLEKEAQRIQTLPQNSEMRQEATRRMLGDIAKKFHEGVHNQKLSKNNIKENFGYLANVSTSVWQAGVLSGIPTLEVNAAASLLSVGLETLFQSVAYAYKANDIRYMAEGFLGMLDALTGNKETGRKSGALMQAGQSLKEGTTKYRNAAQTELSILETLPTENVPSGIRILNKYLDKWKYVGRAMQALDAINMSMADMGKQRLAYRYFLQTEKKMSVGQIDAAMQDAFNPGKSIVAQQKAIAATEVEQGMPDADKATKEKWTERRTIELLENRRESIVEGIRELGKEFAEMSTMNSQASGVVGYITRGIVGQLNSKLKVTQFFLSFMNTMGNLVNQAVDFTPYGLLRANNISAGQILFSKDHEFAPKTYAKGSPDRAAEYAKAIAGTTALLTIAAMAAKGLEDELQNKEPWFAVYGAGPMDSMEKVELASTKKWQANSVKIGGAILRYVDWPVLGIILGAYGTVCDTIRYKKDEQTSAEIAMAAGVSAVSTLLDKNMLQSISNFFQMITSKNTGQQAASFKKVVGGIVGGYTNPGLFRWARNTFGMDEKGMVPRLDQGTTEGWFYSLMPFSIGYNTPALNSLGEEIKSPFWSASTWRFIDVSGIPPHPIYTPLVAAGLRVPNPSKSTQFQYKDATGKIQKTMVGKYPDVMRRYVQVKGESMKKILTPQVIQSYVNTAKVNLNYAKQSMLHDVGGSANDYAVSVIENEISTGKLKMK